MRLREEALSLDRNTSRETALWVRFRFGMTILTRTPLWTRGIRSWFSYVLSIIFENCENNREKGEFFSQKNDAAGRLGLSPITKATTFVMVIRTSFLINGRRKLSGNWLISQQTAVEVVLSTVTKVPFTAQAWKPPMTKIRCFIEEYKWQHPQES